MNNEYNDNITEAIERNDIALVKLPVCEVLVPKTEGDHINDILVGLGCAPLGPPHAKSISAHTQNGFMLREFEYDYEVENLGWGTLEY